ncbi:MULTISPECIES: hypothetical protein [Candidatus Ichthyocystis]|uniref:Uncharacterized protein n=1 Tax=Candidatus Ichthyocystis hellenicum TaxID=1561003 RepID=A0A0S4M9G7_9BURK|nr:MULTISPECIES: hypothetical protein [Ichthyocystis]CUT18100.1 hypothetical protein Ark11_1296 [Candidatus Ichthyocystis hellenicum]
MIFSTECGFYDDFDDVGWVSPFGSNRNRSRYFTLRRRILYVTLGAFDFSEHEE